MMLASDNLQPDPVALQSLMDWIQVRDLITVVRRSRQTTEVFLELTETVSFTEQQKALFDAAQRMYEDGRHKIHSVFAKEDLSVQLLNCI